VVLVDTSHARFDSITIDNERGAYLATRHLLALGHRKIGLLSANLESVPARERLAGYQRAMREARIPVDQHLMKRTTSPVLDGFTQETGYALMREFLSMGRARPRAVVVSSDIQAMGALEALREAGVSCPEEMAIVGFDDIVVASHLGLTTMRQPMFQMGFLAAERLLERMEKRDLAPLHTTFTPELVVRKTCGGPSRTTDETPDANVLSTAAR
jgi:LacI family transcriptional regulator